MRLSPPGWHRGEIAATGYLPPVNDVETTLKQINELKAGPDEERRSTLMDETLADRRRFLTARKSSLKKLQERYPGLFSAQEVRFLRVVTSMLRVHTVWISKSVRFVCSDY